MKYGAYYGRSVLITGGCGFIGSHLAEQLVALGAQVTILDDLSTGSLDNIAHIKDQVRFVRATIADKHACEIAMIGQSIVFHLAALISVPESVKNPTLCHDINVNGTFNILHAAHKAGIKRVVFSSSSAVYGNTQEICSEQNRCNPESPYGFSKHIGELMCQQYARMYGLETVILRYFNVYGARQNPNGAYAAVVAKFTEHIKYNRPITIFGDGLQTRDFIHVSSVVDANLTLGFASVEQGDIYNIATGNSITLLELVEQLKATSSKYTAPIYFQEARSGDLKHSKADISKYEALSRQYYGKPAQEMSQEIVHGQKTVQSVEHP